MGYRESVKHEMPVPKSKENGAITNPLLKCLKLTIYFIRKEKKKGGAATNPYLQRENISHYSISYTQGENNSHSVISHTKREGGIFPHKNFSPYTKEILLVGGQYADSGTHS